MTQTIPKPLSHSFASCLAGATSPCVSLYLPMHSSHPEREQDPIRYRSLLKKAEKALRHSYPEADLTALMQRFETLATEVVFWSHHGQGLAIFAAPNLFRAFTTKRPVPYLVVVADAFHTAPLKLLLQSAGHYHVLAINRQEVRLFEGNRDALSEIELAPEVPPTLFAALSKNSFKSNADNIGDSAKSELAEPAQTPAPHSHFGRVHEEDRDVERFFRMVDEAVTERHSLPTKLPLILVALPEHHALFHKISQNPFLEKKGVEKSPDSYNAEELRAQVWEVIEPKYQASLAAITEKFENARAHGTGSDELAEVAKMAWSGRVETLLVENERRLPGRIDFSTGNIEIREAGDSSEDNLIDDLLDLTTSKGGTVVALPSNIMPGLNGAAAIYRY